MIGAIVRKTNVPVFVYRMLRWHARYLFGKRVTPLAFGLYLTSACNFRCDFCNIRRASPGFTVPEEEALALAEQLGRAGVVYFSISGGEPLLVPHVFRTLARARERGVLYTHLVSNGYLLDDAKAKEMAAARVSEISLSIDGPEDEHDARRGMPGAYRHVLEAVARIQTHAPRTRIVLNAIFRPHRPEEVLHAVRIAKELGVRIKIQPENDHPALGGDEIAPPVNRAFTAEERERVLEVLERLGGMKHVANSRVFLKQYGHFLFDREKLAFRGEACIYGYHHLESFNRRIVPCLEGMGWSGGAPLEGCNLEALVRSREYRGEVEALRTCNGCRKNYYVCYYEPRLNFPVWHWARFHQVDEGWF